MYGSLAVHRDAYRISLSDGDAHSYCAQWTPDFLQFTVRLFVTPYTVLYLQHILALFLHKQDRFYSSEIHRM